MADPLSIAASVGGLALLAKDVVKLIVSITGTVRGASSQLQELRQSVALLCGYLESLSLILDDDDDEPAPMSILACNRTLDKIKRLLEKVGASSAAPASTSSTLPTKHGAWQDVKQKVRWVIDKDEAEKLSTELEKHKSVLSLALSKKSLISIIEVLRKQDATLQQMEEIRKEQSQIRQQQIQDTEKRLSKERRKMLSAVSQMRPEDSFKKHLSLHQDGTGVWFLESLEFEKFMNTPNSELWLYGIPGAGKSVLSATIIHHISTQRTEHVALAYFFCEYFNTATQNCRNIFGSIARQLALQNLRALETLEEFFNDETDLGQLDFNPEDDELRNLIVQMSTNFDNTIILIDGLDECQENRTAVVESLAQLSRAAVGSIKTLYTSRKESDIQERLSSFDNLAIAAYKADVRLYVAAQLKSRFRKICEKDPALSEEILSVLVEKSDGMFQWVRCQIDCLENLASNKQRRKALEDLPRDLHGTYERILLRAINLSEHGTLDFVERTLRWIALAKEPLSVAQIAHAISVEIEDRSFDDSLDMRIILAFCSSLVREVNGKLAFSHFSVKEYLMQISPEKTLVARFRISNSDHSLLAQTCLTYLLLEDFDRQGSVAPADLRPVDDTREDREWVYDPYPSYPFYRYAAYKWRDHAENCIADDSISTLEYTLFDPTKTDQFLFWAHLQLLDMLYSTKSVWALSRKMYDIAPIHLACIFRLTHVVDRLLCDGADANVLSAVLGSPLQCAISSWNYDWLRTNHSETRRETVCRLLREPISKDQSRYDPLAAALGQGDEAVASILLEHGFALTRYAVEMLERKFAPRLLSKVDLKDLDMEVELSLREKFGDLDFLRSSQSAQDGTDQTEPIPFHLSMDYKKIVRQSCSFGRLEVVKSSVPCLRKSFTVDRFSNFLSECLIEAAAYGHSDVVRYLIEESANPAFQSRSDGRTALHEASEGCHVDVVRTLLAISDDSTAIAGIQDNNGLTPWMCAIKAGSVETLELFFLAGPSKLNLRTVARNGQTAAHMAARTGNKQMVSYSKKIGIDFSCPDRFGVTPIHALLMPHCKSIHSIPDFKSFRDIFRYLQWSDMLSFQTQSGQTLVHMIAQLDPLQGKLLWQDIQDNQILDATRDKSLTTTDSKGDIPLHALMHNLDLYMMAKGCESRLLDNFVEFVQLLSTDNVHEFGQLHMKNRNGCTPVMELAQSIKNVVVLNPEKYAVSDYLLKAFKSLEDTREGCCCLGEVDNDKCTILHCIAECRTNFPFKEITEYLLERPIDVTAKNLAGQSALMCAARSPQNNVDFIRLLIPRTGLSELEEQDSSGFTILHHLCKRKKVGIQDLLNDCLLEAVAKCEKKDLRGRIPLIHAPCIVTDYGVASELVKFAEKTSGICDNDGKNCMYWSCESGSIVMVSALLDAGTNINAPLGPGSERGAARNPPLLIAVSSEDFELVDFLLKKGADPLVKGEGGWQLHHYAFSSGRYELLASLENLTGCDFDAKANFHMSLHYSGGKKTEVLIENAAFLHFIAGNDNEQGLQWLLDHDKVSDVNVQTRDGSTPLILASLHGSYGMCKRLIELGSLILKARYDGYTALHAACQYGHFEVSKLLIEADNDCLLQNFRKQTPLEIAVKHKHLDIAELLLKHEEPVTVGAKTGALKANHHDIVQSLRRKLAIENETSAENATNDMRPKAACDASSESMLEDVLQNDIDPNIRLSHKYRTPLHLSCQNDWKEVVELLVERNANMEAADKDGCTPLMIAVRSGHRECTELLCRKGARTTTRDINGFTILHYAASRNDSKALAHFLEEGVEVNVQTYSGYTPLHVASDPGCVDLLLKHGADPFVSVFLDQTVAWRYCSCKNGAELLRRIFADQPAEKVQQSIETICLRQKSTPLYRAAFLGNWNAVSTLIEYGAKVNGRCGPLGAPLHAALRQGHVEIATMLLENGARPYRIVRDGEENAGWFWEYGYEFCLQDRNGVWVSRSL